MTEGAPCPSCAMPIPPVVAHAPFCPYCGTRKAGQTDRAAELMAVLKAKAARQAPEKQASEKVFSTSHRNLYLTFDPRAGYALLGPAGDPARLCAYDLYNKRVAWEALAGAPGIDKVDYESLRVHAGNVYVGTARMLYVLDLFTGTEKWRAELSDKLHYDSRPFPTRGMRVADAAEPGARGAVWAVATDDVITALDRDTGQPLWRETREYMPRRFRPFEGGMLLLESGGKVEIVDPATKKVHDSIEGRIERLDLDGRCGLLQVERWGWRERDGILVHDFVAKKELLFEAFEDLEDDVPTVAAHGRVYAAAESGAKLVAGPKGKPVELVPAFHIRALAMCGPTLMVLLRKHHGTSLRRFVGVDPQTLAVRFDLGELATHPSDDWEFQLCSNGQVAVLVTGRGESSQACELVAIDATGRTVWKLDVHDWRAHYFLGSHLVVQSSAGWQLVRPDTGEVVSALGR